MIPVLPRHASALRRELNAANAAFAEQNRLNHVLSYGEAPVIVYAPTDDGRCHGNFFDRSYAAIMKNPEWSRRLQKVHTHKRTSLPRAERMWRELDSCMSSDALLMNIFCCPGVCRNPAVAFMLGTEITDLPEFGYKAHVPLRNGRSDRTEVDMKLGRLLVEAKLTESDFQTCPHALLEQYRDLEAVFEIQSLPRTRELYVSSQLIRNVLAAAALDASFCVMTDARRPDLIEAWHAIMRCITDVELRTRCKVLTWQELTPALPRKLQKFLEAKYGIRAASC